MFNLQNLQNVQNLAGGANGAVAVLPTAGLLQWLFNSANTDTQAVDKQGLRSGTVFAGRVYDFDGVDDYVDLPDLSITRTSDYSVAFWMIPGKVANGGIFQHANSTSDRNGLVFASSKLAGGSYNGTTYDGCRSDSILSIGTRYHVVYVRDNTNGDKIYINGADDTAVSGVSTSLGSTEKAIGYTTNGSFYYDGKLWGFRIYDSALTASDALDLYNGTEVAASFTALYKMDEGDGTTAFDSSGNANHGTITNATLSTFHTTDTEVEYSWLNQVGYTESDASTYYLNDDDTGLIPSGVLIPRDESNTTKCAAYLSGGAQADLDQVGLVNLNADFVESNCGDFDGTDDYGDVGGNVNFTGAFDFRVQFNADDLSGTPAFFGGSGADNVIINASGTIRTRIDNTYYDISGITISTGTDYKLRVVRDASDNLTYHVNDVEYNTIASASGTFTFRYIGSRDGTSQFFDGCLWDLRLQGEFVTTRHYPMAEGNGTVLYDAGTAADHATLTNITESTFWGNSQDVYHYNIVNGFEHYDDDATGLVVIRVPYTSAGGQITPTISGYTKNTNNPAGAWHNDAETKLQMSAVAPSLKDAAFWYTGATREKRGYSDIVANYASGDVTFADVSVTNKKKNLVTYDSVQSGSTLDKIKKFLNIS